VKGLDAPLGICLDDEWPGHGAHHTGSVERIPFDRRRRARPGLPSSSGRT